LTATFKVKVLVPAERTLRLAANKKQLQKALGLEADLRQVSNNARLLLWATYHNPTFKEIEMPLRVYEAQHGATTSIIASDIAVQVTG
jgi:hypothetical protein